MPIQVTNITIRLKMHFSDTFPTMLIKHLRRGCFVTRSKISTCYPLVINARRGCIENFHHYFFTLPPDDSYIKWTLGKALYMADGTALKQKQALDESGFFNELVSSSAFCTIVCDSINLNEHTREFTYYGHQIIKRPSRTQRRRLVSTGFLENVRRSENNPHGMLITRWKTIENSDMSY